jgi:Cell division protein CrgA
LWGHGNGRSPLTSVVVMPPKTRGGPGRAQNKGRSEGRATKSAAKRAKSPAPGAGGVGRYTSAEQSGRYTRPTPKSVRRSARWFGPLILFLMIFGVLTILLNYLTVLPGAVSVWYLVTGLVIIFAAFRMATRYR